MKNLSRSTSLRSGLPIALDGIIAKALAKDPATRYQHVDELPADLKALDTATINRSRITTTAQSPTSSKPAGGSRLPWVITGLALLTSVVLAVLWQTTQRNEPRPVTRFTIPLREGHTVTYGIDWVQQAVSPDGRKIVYVTQTSRGVSQLYLRDLEGIEASPISGTEGGSDPFFSPDGQWIGFRGNGKLWKLSVFGGKPLALCDGPPGGLSATWGNGAILFTPRFNLGLWQVSEEGGEPKALTEPDETKQEAGHRFPQILPDGERVVFASVTATSSALYWKRRDGTGETERLTPTSIQWSDDYGTWSPDGKVLVYSDVAPATLNDIWLLSYPEKKAELFWSTTFREREPAFSPDGRWIAYASDESGRYEINLRPFPAKEPKVSISNDGGRTPFWSRDGRELFYLKGRRLMVVPMQLQPTLRPGIPRELFELPAGIRLANGISKDDQRFLALQSESEKEQRFQHLIVVQNWFEEVKRKMQEKSR